MCLKYLKVRVPFVKSIKQVKSPKYIHFQNGGYPLNEAVFTAAFKELRPPKF